MLYFLSKNHEELFGKEPQEYQKFKVDLYNLQVQTHTDVRYCPSQYHADIFELDPLQWSIKREKHLGRYIEYIDPTKIVNNVLTDRPLIHSPRIAGLKKSIEQYGVISPILVHTVPEWHMWWKHRKFEEGKYIVKEGRHRALATELVGYKFPIPSFVLIPLHPKEAKQWTQKN